MWSCAPLLKSCRTLSSGQERAGDKCIRDAPSPIKLEVNHSVAVGPKVKHLGHDTIQNKKGIRMGLIAKYDTKTEPDCVPRHFMLQLGKQTKFRLWIFKKALFLKIMILHEHRRLFLGNSGALRSYSLFHDFAARMRSSVLARLKLNEN